VSSSGQFSCLPTVSISIIHTGRHISKPSLLESTNTTCWFLGVSATSVRCNLAFNFSIFWKRTPTTLYIYIIYVYKQNVCTALIAKETDYNFTNKCHLALMHSQLLPVPVVHGRDVKNRFFKISVRFGFWNKNLVKKTRFSSDIIVIYSSCNSRAVNLQQIWQRQWMTWLWHH